MGLRQIVARKLRAREIRVTDGPERISMLIIVQMFKWRIGSGGSAAGLYITARCYVFDSRCSPQI